ncbi:hypothetical protein ACFPL7_13290 [Dongia soli]|uniref:MFS transporter n=1 Tax=Dongia soli TaxID=600628 RepID=A0ABU5EHI0_9PROT|nr:hypothetical protein [Dongia soli]MDY0884960.1 hypothetical protein [Dongia soli]
MLNRRTTWHMPYCATSVCSLNAGGVLIYLPFIGLYATLIVSFAASPAMAVAWATTLFNLSIGIVFVAFLPWFERQFLRSVDRP